MRLRSKGRVRLFFGSDGRTFLLKNVQRGFGRRRRNVVSCGDVKLGQCNSLRELAITSPCDFGPTFPAESHSVCGWRHATGLLGCHLPWHSSTLRFRSVQDSAIGALPCGPKYGIGDESRRRKATRLRRKPSGGRRAGRAAKTLWRVGGTKLECRQDDPCHKCRFADQWLR